MKKKFLVALFLLPSVAFCQSKLTIEKIMQDPAWIGTSPSGTFWSLNSDTLFFNWNPEKAPSDSLYFITLKNTTPQKASPEQKRNTLRSQTVQYNQDRSAYVYSIDGDIYYQSIKPAKLLRVTQTVETESGPQFSADGKKIYYQRDRNFYSWDVSTGQTVQLTNFVTEQTPSFARGSSARGTQAEQWLANEQKQYIEVLKERSEKREAARKYREQFQEKDPLRKLATGGKQLSGVSLSPDGMNVSYRLYDAPAPAKGTIVPDYVTESGYTTDIPGRRKVGEPQGSYAMYVYDKNIDSVFKINTDNLPGIREVPEFYKDYPKVYDSLKKKNAPKGLRFGFVNPWSPDGKYLLIDARSQDNKDRWLLIWDATTHELVTADHQHDEAWIAGPGLFNIGWLDNQTIYYQSEKTGYSHLYLYNVKSKSTRALTEGNYEVQSASLSPDKKYFYITTNEVEPGQKHFYKLEISSARKQQITTMTGGNEATVSPDGKNIAILYSYSNVPTELYLQKNEAGSKAQQITNLAQSDEWKSYSWRDPEVVAFTARDGAKVYARVFKPNNPKPGMPAVVFVHGAGYLQNAHKWWSTYFRENMFHNFLADNGYYVIDADYRGSAGYGRDWRTGIYRYMGDKDLNDNVDAAEYLVKTYQVDPKKIGIYGGSYGGFITLMAMFTTPDVFAAGAGLRSVTEWANYNHGYTSNILNEPFNDSIAYRRSSPIYFAEGLKGHLLMCHGLVDVNVHAQDIIKLTQRLIELKKDNWELALYPVEDHGFVEPTSWMDEYKRIYKLFENTLKNQ